MADRNERDSAEDSGYVSHAGSVWAPSGLVGGMSGVGLLSALLGIVALVLAAVGAFPVFAWLLAVIGIISVLRLFLPRVTTKDKILITVGAAASLTALVILLLSLGQGE
jgi:hypothetical protein